MKSAAATKAIGQAARWLTDSPHRAAVLGAGVGATQGVMNRGDDGSITAALRGGLRGAAVGGAAGGLGRMHRDTRLLNPTLGQGQAVGETAKRIGGAAKRFGQRQLHGLTGAYSSTPGAIGMRGSEQAAKELRLHHRRILDETAHGASPKRLKALGEKLKDIESQGHAGDAATKAGITSLPGVAKGMATKPIATAKALGRTMIGGSGTGAAIAVGLPLAIAAPDLARGDESSRGGRSVKQKLFGVGSGLAGGMLTAGVPVIPQLVGGTAVDAAATFLTKKRSTPGGAS